MNATLKKVLWFLVLAMAAIGAAAVYWRMSHTGLPLSAKRGPLALGLMAFMPVMLAATVVIADRKLGSDRPRMAEDHRRYFQIGLGSTFLFALAAQAWTALVFVQQAPAGPEVFLRLAAIWAGVSMAMRGNFMAKAGPPSGEGAPDRNRWSPAMLRMGWLLVLWGAVLVVCAVALPFRPLFWVYLATAPVLVLAVANYRRALKV